MGYIRIKDYEEKELGDSSDIKNIQLIANVGLLELCKQSDAQMIVFPSSLGAHYDGIETQEIISLINRGGKYFIKAGDLLGFIGVGGTYLSIGTRFTSSEVEGKEDYLLYYMLQKVLRINIFNLNHTICDDSAFDILSYMFAGLLSRALRQGLLKRYTRFDYNNSRIKGNIDVARHVKHNIPFNGKIAFSQRERTASNLAIQLIRHTIEVIRSTSSKIVLALNSQIKTDIATIESVTCDYVRKDRQRVIHANKRRNPHPYYTAYEPLLNLCIAILEHKKNRYDVDNKIIHGILFSGSWLWEEYLYVTLFSPLGFIHPDNRKKSNAIYLFDGKLNEETEEIEKLEKDYEPRYPDYILEVDSKEREDCKVAKMIVDAKYRHHGYCGDRENLNQLITYMFITKSQMGALIYPIGTENNDKLKSELKKELLTPKSLKGYGGKYYRIGFEIPQDVNNYNEFSERMRNEEERLYKALGKILQKE